MQIKSKLPNIGTTIFTVMSGLAKEHNAINLSQGFPDFSCHPKLLELAQKHLTAGFNQYAPMTGAQPLREVISELLQNCYGAVYHPETEITITAGATQGIYTSIAAFINKGDEVIVFEPAYDCYIPAIDVHGGVAKSIHLEYPNFTINWNTVRNTITDKTKMIIINSPHNPSGTTLKESDLFDVLEYIRFALTPISRKERSAISLSKLNELTENQKSFVKFLAEKLLKTTPRVPTKPI
jgi:methionine aminotransferase